MNFIDTISQIDQRLYHAHRAAMNCEDLMMHYYDRGYEIKIDTKSYDSASGLAAEDSPELVKLGPDKFCDRICREYLTLLYPEFGFVGEESFEESELKKEIFWCVDPICGSMGYKKKTGFFGTSVALVDRKRGPILGALNCPVPKIGGIASLEAGKTLYYGSKQNTNSGGLRVLISANRKNSEPFLEMLNLLNPSETGYQESIPTKSMNVLLGSYDLHFNLPRDFQGGSPKIWDLAASQVFYDVEGMYLTDFRGGRLDLTGKNGYRYSDGYIMAKDRKILDLCLEAFEKIK